MTPKKRNSKTQMALLLRDLRDTRPYKPPKAPHLTAANRLERCHFRKTIGRRPKTFFTKLIFSDEKLFDTQDHGNAFQYLEKGKSRTIPSPLIPREQHQYPASVMVWGAIGVGYRFLKVIEMRTPEEGGGGMDQQIYLEQCLKKMWRGKAARAELKGRVLMQDGAKIHWTPMIREWAKKNKVDLLVNWPSSSPDLNPIERLWAILSKMVSERGPYGKENLAQFVVEEFHKIPQSLIDTLVLSFAGKLKKCADGAGATVR